MQLFSRAMYMNGPAHEVTAHAVGLCQYVSERSGRDVSLWAARFGAPLGTMVYSMRVEGLADLSAVAATLQDDADYHARVAAGRQYVMGPVEDSLATPIWGEFADTPPTGSVATLTRAVIANGAYEAAIGWGVDIAQYVTELSGMPVAFLSADYGTFGQVSWIGVAPDPAAADAANATVNGDPEYLKRLGAAGDLFVAGSGQRLMLARVA